ncbi:MAG: RNA methyltransferase [Beijerinckiaceae bacterium]|nr:RNA methyltransferase [Beijerinckiaceae bacterium]
MYDHTAIQNPSDDRLAPYRDIRERDLVGRQGHFIAEGEVVLRVLARFPRFHIRSCLIAENRVEALAPLLHTLPDDCQVIVASRAVIESVAGFDVHRGVLALGERPPKLDVDAFLAALPQQAVIVVAVGIANHDNMGGIFRNAAAFGADAVLIDPTSCDPLYRKAIRVSVGGVFKTPFARLPANAGDILAAHGFEQLALTPSASERLADYRRADRVAIYLGAEGPGLPDAVLARCRRLAIPMHGGFDSLNVATTSGIVLHHLGKSPATQRP